MDRGDIHMPHKKRTGGQMVRESRTESQGRRASNGQIFPSRIQKMFAVYCANVLTEIDAESPPLLTQC
jgi:hypothetical protein